MPSCFQFRAVQANRSTEKSSNAKLRIDQGPCNDSCMCYRKGNAETIFGRNFGANHRKVRSILWIFHCFDQICVFHQPSIFSPAFNRTVLINWSGNKPWTAIIKWVKLKSQWALSPYWKISVRQTVERVHHVHKQSMTFSNRSCITCRSCWICSITITMWSLKYSKYCAVLCKI